MNLLPAARHGALYLLTSVMLWSCPAWCQSGSGAAAADPDDALFTRLTAMSVNGIDYYNVDGVEMSTQELRSSFHGNAIRGRFPAFSVGSRNLNASDSAVALPNYFVSADARDKRGYYGNSTTYFIKTSDTGVRAIRFVTPFLPDRSFQRRFVSIILAGAVPASCFTGLRADSFDFAGRKMAKDPDCRWMSLNNLQCSAFGQMNWSMHRRLEDAQHFMQRQYEDVIAANKVRPLSDDTVAVVFEGVPVRAHRVMVAVKGLGGLVTRAAGATTLTAYYLAAEVRGRYVHCVLSHWNTAVNGPGGLPLLLEQVMKIEEQKP